MGFFTHQILRMVLVCLAGISALGYAGVFKSSEIKTEADGVDLLVGEDYAKRVEELILSAKTRVWMAVYVANFQKDRAYSVENKLFNALAKVHSQGVDVKVILDEGLEWDSQKNAMSSRRSIKNDSAYEFLQSKGIPVRMDSPEQIMHGKFLVVDERYAVLGSHNWTYSALAKNVEVSVLLSRESDSQEVAKVFAKLWGRSQER
jgi:phosphatidylserine/phosphatidylglycerophosphate/cardiolipin synthase-like enzyme